MKPEVIARLKRPRYKLPALAQMLGVCEKTVRRWTAAGKLPQPWRPFGGALQWDAEEVAEAVKNFPNPSKE